MRRPAIHAVAVVVMAAIALFPAGSGAEGVTGYVDYSFSKATTESKDSAGAAFRSDFGTFLQRYNLQIDKRLYPNLRLLSGGLFEKSDTNGSVETQTTSQDIDTTTTKMRPFVDVSLSTPLYRMAANYSRSEDRQESQGTPPLTLIRDQYAGMVGWNPEGFPSLVLQYLRSDNHDVERVLQDLSSQSYQVTSRYQPISPVSLYYQGTFTEVQDRLNRNETNNILHNARIGYADHWLNRRVSFSSDYNVSHRETETRAEGGEVTLPLQPQAGLSAIDDTPEQGALAANPSLVDGDLQAGSGINIGLPPPGGNTQRRNIGLDFGLATAVNTLFVWIDRELPAGVANSFSWDIYTSPDNLNWTLIQTVQPAVLDPFVPRFRIDFAGVTARFVKAVTRPLSPVVPLSADFPIIQVTELQAALRSPAAAVAGSRSSTSHIYNLSVRTRILNVPALSHELNYSYAAATGSPSRFSLSNGLFAGHNITRNVTAMARVAREDSDDAGRKTTSYVYSGSIAASPLPALRHSVLLSGRNDFTDEGDSRSLSLFLYNTAGLYKGIDANLSAGRSLNVNVAGQRTDSTQADVGVVIVPNRKVTLSGSYSSRWDEISGGAPPVESKGVTRSMEGSVAVSPVETVYFFGSYREEEPAGQNRRTISTYSASWAPFPDGKLNLGLLYNETHRSETDGKDRTISPSLRLNIGRGSFISLAYQRTTSRDNIQSIESDVYSSNLRIIF